MDCPESLVIGVCVPERQSIGRISKQLGIQRKVSLALNIGSQFPGLRL